MTTEQYLHIFFQGSDLLETDDEDSICIGTMLPIYSPAGVERLMQYHTALIDEALTLPHLSALDTVTLLAMRGITYHEFCTVLFDTTIKAQDFHLYSALRCMFFSSDKERREKLFYTITRDWNGYERLLAQMLQPFHSLIFQFLFEDES